MTAATLTAPLDVLKTRLQSDFYQSQVRSSRPHLQTLTPFRAAMHHLTETLQILASVYRIEGPRALFKGLGPNLVGVVPARSINFYTYGNGKRIIAEYLNGGRESAWVHLSAAAAAGIVTSTATNPIWMIKTRLQLDKNVAEQSGGATKRQYRNSLDCTRQVLRKEGFTSLYRGMSASYLGAAESTMHWVLYEQMKGYLARREEAIVLSGREKTLWDQTVDWTGKVVAAGSAKLVASVATYPHEVSLPLKSTLNPPPPLFRVEWRLTATGRPDTATTGAHGRRPAQVHGPGAVLPARLARGGPRGPVWRHDAALDADGAERRHHVWHVRGDPAAARRQGVSSPPPGRCTNKV